jgi:RHS repeat-associated protein
VAEMVTAGTCVKAFTQPTCLISIVSDAENRLIKVESRPDTPSSSWRRIEWTYDAFGRRIQQVRSIWTNNAWFVVENLKFVSDPMLFGRHIVELNATNNSLVRSYAWGLDLSGTMDSAGGVSGLLWVTLHTVSGPAAGTHFASYDGNGNVVALVSATTGTETACYEFGPFGEPIRVTGPAATLNPFRFSTKRTCNTSDLVLYEYRAYSPCLGRWLSRDPIGEAGSGNLYGFVDNRPSNSSDLLGLSNSTGGANAAEKAWCWANPICCCVARNSGAEVKAEMAKRYPGWQDNTVENAVQHCAWICYVASKALCSKAEAISLGQAHENYPGNPAHDKAMDLYNNSVGADIGGKNLVDCFNRCEVAAKGHRLYWWQVVRPGPPRQGLPSDFPGFTVDGQGRVTGGTVGTGSINPPAPPAP